MHDSNPAPLFAYVAEQLNQFNLAYLHIIEPRVKGNIVIHENQGPVASAQLRTIFNGKIIAAGGFESDTAEDAVAAGVLDAVAFGRHFISNPDLPRRIREGCHLPNTIAAPSTRLTPKATTTIQRTRWRP